MKKILLFALSALLMWGCSSIDGTDELKPQEETTEAATRATVRLRTGLNVYGLQIVFQTNERLWPAPYAPSPAYVEPTDAALIFANSDRSRVITLKRTQASMCTVIYVSDNRSSLPTWILDSRLGANRWVNDRYTFLVPGLTLVETQGDGLAFFNAIIKESAHVF